MKRAKAAGLLRLFLPAPVWLLANYLLRRLLIRLGLGAADAAGLSALLLLPPLLVWYRDSADAGRILPGRWTSWLLAGLCAVCAALSGGFFVRLFGAAPPVPARPLAILGLCFAAPAAEEVLCRGILLGRGRALLGTPLAFALSVLLFAGAHLTPGAASAALLFGAALGAIYLYGGSLLPPIFAHIGANCFALLRPGALPRSLLPAGTLVLLGLTFAALVLRRRGR